jgi:hypothetical protein
MFINIKFYLHSLVPADLLPGCPLPNLVALRHSQEVSKMKRFIAAEAPGRPLCQGRAVCVYRSEARDPWQKKRAVQAQVFSQEGQEDRTPFRGTSSESATMNSCVTAID